VQCHSPPACLEKLQPLQRPQRQLAVILRHSKRQRGQHHGGIAALQEQQAASRPPKVALPARPATTNMGLMEPFFNELFATETAHGEIKGADSESAAQLGKQAFSRLKPHYSK
jgi:hypothetical protein